MACETGSTEGGSISKWIAIICVAAFVATLGYFRSRHLDAVAAMNGFSPEQLALAVNHPDLLAGNYPSGILTLLSSIVFHVYPLSDRMGVNVTSVWEVMIFLEVGAFAGAVFYAVRRLMPGVGWPVAAVVAISYAGSNFLTPDMARLQFPYYGWVYGFAHACFLIVCTETVRRNYLVAAAVLVLEFMVHPITAVFAGTFVVAILAFRFATRKLEPPGRLVAPVALVLVGCGLWLAYIASHATITGGAVDSATFIALNHALNFHWFPSYSGLYWELFWYKLLPLLSTLALIAWAFDAQIVPFALRRELAFGAVVLSAVCCTGLVVAETVTWPPLIKLALHRADTSVLLIGGLVLIPVLVRDIVEGDPIERLLSVYLVLSPFFFDGGLAPLPVILRIAYATYRGWPEGTIRGGLRTALALVALMSGLFVFYAAMGLVPDPLSTKYTGLNGTLFALALLITLVLFMMPSNETSDWRVAARSSVVLLPVLLLALRGAPEYDLLHDQRTLARANSALDAQLWARLHTPERSIFMVDPALDYFWRDKSHRPSFGTPREWLLMSVIYNSQRNLLEEGMKRYRALGLPDPDYIYDPSNSRLGPLLNRITNDASRQFYALDKSGLERLAKTYNIRYFVFMTTGLKGDPPLPVVFRNSHFVIATAGNGQP